MHVLMEKFTRRQDKMTDMMVAISKTQFFKDLLQLYIYCMQVIDGPLIQAIKQYFYSNQA